MLPPLRTCWRSLVATRSTCLDTACSTSFSRALIAWSTNWRSIGSRELRYSSTVGRADAGGDQALDLRRDVGGDDQRGKRLAVANLGDRLVAGMNLDRLDGLKELTRVLGDIDLLVAEVDLPLAGGNLAVERHLRFSRRTGEGEPDHQRDRDRIDDQQADQQRRAPEDLEVLDQQPAHSAPAPDQCPRSCRKRDERALEVPRAAAHGLARAPPGFR